MKRLLIVWGLAVCVQWSTGVQGAILETFSDGDDNGWVHFDPMGSALGPADFSVVDGEYQISGVDPLGSRLIASFLPISVATGSIGAKVTALGEDTSPFLLMRADPSTMTSFVFALAPEHAGEGTPGMMTVWKISNGELTFVDGQEFENGANEAFFLSASANGNEFIFSATPEGPDGMPGEGGASLTVTGDPLMSGLVGLGLANNVVTRGATLAARFDDVFVGYSLVPPMIPEPGTLGLLMGGLLLLVVRGIRRRVA